MQIVLASGSPRRKELLEQIGLEFQICPAKGEEKINSTIPEKVVEELAGQKAFEVASGLAEFNENHSDITEKQDILVIGADTVVAFDGKILGKPKDEENAKSMLAMLSGNMHSVYTGVSVIIISKEGKTGQFTFHEKTDVFFEKMTSEEINAYVATGDPMDKAGAYGIQGPCAAYIEKIQGDYNNVVGFPLARFYKEMKKLGINLKEK